MDCRVALAPRNDAKLVGLPTSQNTFTPDAQLARSPRPIGERVEFVSELCELRNSGEGLKNYSLKQHPPTTSGHFPRKGGRRGGAQLAYIHHFLKFMSLRGNIHSARSNPEGITQLKTVGCVKPNNNNMDCRVASAPRNDAKPVVSPANSNIYPHNDVRLVVLPTRVPSLRDPSGAWQSILFNCYICSGLLRAEWLFPRNDDQLVGLLHN